MSPEDRITVFGQQLSACIGQQKNSGWLDDLIYRLISDETFRIQALRFIDTLPVLNDDQQLAQHLQEYFGQLELPQFAAWSLKHSDNLWAAHIAAPTVRHALRILSRRFMGGSRLHQALATVSGLRHRQMNFSLDLLGEASLCESECETYQHDYLTMMNALDEPLTHWTQHDLLDNHHGRVSPRLNVSIKLSSLHSQITTADPAGSRLAIAEKLRPIFQLAKKRGAFVTIDMEQYDYKHIVLQCFRELLMEKEFRNWPDAGIALQAYLRDTVDDLQTLINWAKNRGTPVTVRLVRGAYWDYETVIAKQNGWPCPVWQHKDETDIHYEKCLQILFENYPHIETAVAGHNPRSLACAMAMAEQYKISPDRFEFQMLHGMADHLKQTIVKMGYRLRVYVPYGDTLPGMAYLVRRLLENSSGQNLLTTGFSANGFAPDFSAPKLPEVHSTLDATKKFRNHPALRFTAQNERDDFHEAIRQVRKHLGEGYPLIINNRHVAGDDMIESRNPAQPDEIIGIVAEASPVQADVALEAALDAFPAWSNRCARSRADLLRRIAQNLHRRRMEFAAWQILEAGKNWREADGDVCEAIDFLNYYADQAEKLSAPHINELHGEHNQYYHRGRGVSLVIPPWNFPLAILTGMLAANLAAGNTVILKPSSLTPVIAARFMQLMIDSGLPPGVVNFLPGSGRRIGEYLARKAEISVIAFTGSQQVGTRLLQIGGQLQPGQTHIKRVIAEMGGKNTLIIDSDADLDDAITGTLHSAFGYQGQKCSAASRVITVGKIHDRFVERLCAAARSLNIGSPEHPGNFMGPVIDENAYSNIMQAIAQGKQAGELIQFDDSGNLGGGYFIKPAIFAHVDPQSPLAQEEIFGPVLAVLQADDFSHALQLANNTRYALTGGVYSRKPSHLERARHEFRVGNLYLNRKITGALVSRQPFGGFKMSGFGSQAGGEDYLLQFMDTYCVTENTLRRGFAPKID
ncbi:MAG: RHH-type transcriptional regulator, proline utilization regulon repressor / proline dehydrogenase [Pseudomonadota bacterium]|nr:RHH-type transcriptional regulator, proline utilization regulon repressor / proline dehydrogenase [Pseudomonadota bacterium]